MPVMMPMKMRATGVGLALLILCLCACGRDDTGQESGSSALQKAQVRAARIVLPPPGGLMAAGYFELHNPAATALVLEALESAEFESVEMHETVDDDGVSRMRPIANATIAPGETLKFEPGGMHLMLMGSRLAADAPAPTSIRMKLRLRAASGGEVSELDTPFAVQQPGQSSSKADDDPHAHHHPH